MLRLDLDGQLCFALGCLDAIWIAEERGCGLSLG